MTQPFDGVLLIDSGDLASLAAVSLEPDATRLALWPTPPAGASAARAETLRRIVSEKAETYGARVVPDRGPFNPGLEDVPEPIVHGRLLLDALALADRHDCSRIVWPIHIGPNADRVVDLVQRVHLASAMAETGLADQAPLIDLPVMDLTDGEVADLADDSGAPMHLFWPCDGDHSETNHRVVEPCGQCAGCRRWLAAFDQSRLQWPWARANQSTAV